MFTYASRNTEKVNIGLPIFRFYEDQAFIRLCWMVFALDTRTTSWNRPINFCVILHYRKLGFVFSRSQRLNCVLQFVVDFLTNIHGRIQDQQNLASRFSTTSTDVCACKQVNEFDLLFKSQRSKLCNWVSRQSFNNTEPRVNKLISPLHNHKAGVCRGGWPWPTLESHRGQTLYLMSWTLPWQY